MIEHITKDNVNKIKNTGLKEDAMKYVEVYDSFTDYINSTGVKVSTKDYSKKEQELLKKLAEKGANVRHLSNSVVLNQVSPSCDHCRTGMGSATYIITLACNRDCFFCTNKNQADYEEGVKKIYNMKESFARDLKRYKKMTSVGITGGEPLLHPKECADFIKHVKKTSKSIQTRIYTNGDLVTEDILKMLKDAGLDEIRFGLKPDENGIVNENVLKNLALAVKYIDRTMVEMPITPNQLEEMKELMVTLDNIGIFGVNILEFLYPFVHPDDYKGHKYEVSKRPYKILFGYTYAGGVPVSGSQEECLELMLFCLEKGLKMGVHYCNLENKLTSQIYHHNFSIKLNGIEYFSPNDFFIKTVKGYGDDIYKIKELLDHNNSEHYLLDNTRKIIEFSPKDVEFLKDLDIELGITYLAVDIDEEGRHVLRELQIDKIEPKTFNIDEA